MILGCNEEFTPRAITTLPILCSHCCMPSNLDAHPTFKFGKAMCLNPTTALADHKNKWESTGLIEGYYVVGDTAIPYMGFGKHLYYVFSFLSKVDYESGKFIHAPTYTYNEVKRLLELVSIVECE